MLKINREDAIALIFEFCSSKAKKQKQKRWKDQLKWEINQKNKTTDFSAAVVKKINKTYYLQLAWATFPLACLKWAWQADTNAVHPPLSGP